MSDEENTPKEDQTSVDDIMNEGDSDGTTSTPESAPDTTEKVSSPDGIVLENMNNEDLGEDNDDEFELGEPMASDVEAIYDIPVQISAVLGRSTMQVSQLLKLGRGAVVELDRKVGEAIDIYVNNRLIARGEVVVVDDKLGVTMTEIVKTDRN